MQKIINAETKEEIKFIPKDLPMMIHGKEGSGASLFSITLVAGLHKTGSKLLIFTAYHMAKDEFLLQTNDPENVYYLEDEKDIEHALTFQTVFVQSGNIDLFIKIVSSPSVANRIIFIKNIDTIQAQIYEHAQHLKFIVSGDFYINPLQQDFKNTNYNTKILFSPLEGEEVPVMTKYQALIKNNSTTVLATLSN